MYCTRTVRVTLTYADTLTRGGGEGGNPRTVRVCQSYSDLRGYSDKGGGMRVVIRVLYAYCQSYSDLRGYSDKGGGGEGGNPRTVRVLSELL